MSQKETVVIVGAGMAGCFMGYCLAKKGYKVEIYDYRPDVRKKPYDSGRSFNLTLYYRGILAMKKVGLWDEVKDIAIIAEGNAAHYLGGKVVFDKFDGHGDEILYTVHRNNLNGALISAVEKLPNITLHFETKCLAVDKKTKTLTMQKEGRHEPFDIKADVVIGADGVNSIVRAEIQRSQEGTYKQEQEDWAYKEVHITPEMTKNLDLRLQATHTWPRVNSLLIAFPNPDKSFTLMFNLPKEGKESFATLTTDSAVKDYIMTYFPDLQLLLPEIVDAFLNRPLGKFVTVYTRPWYDDDFMVLIGDAAHGVIPFYGQGVCAAFEDCLVMMEYLNRHDGNWAKVFPDYQIARKRNTDVLAKLSKDNFIELRDKSRSMYYIVKDKADTLLHRLFPGLWLPPLYIMIAHGNLEYVEALKLHKRQERRATMMGLNAAIYVATFPWKIGEMFKKD